MSILIDVVKTFSGKSTEKVDKYTQQARVKICQECPFMQNGKLARSCGGFLIGGKVHYNGKEQELCGCNIDDKTWYRDDACPLGKWR